MQKGPARVPFKISAIIPLVSYVLDFKAVLRSNKKFTYTRLGGTENDFKKDKAFFDFYYGIDGNSNPYQY